MAEDSESESAPDLEPIPHTEAHDDEALRRDFIDDDGALGDTLMDPIPLAEAGASDDQVAQDLHDLKESGFLK